MARSIDIHTKSTSKTNERAIGGVTSGLIELEQSVTWEAVHFGIRQRLSAKITEFEYPHRFVDEQVSGAFKCFRHTHEFVAVDDGTLMIDTFDYSSPLGLLGKLADKLFLKSYMREFLLKRNLYIKKAAEELGKNETKVNTEDVVFECPLIKGIIHEGDCFDINLVRERMAKQSLLIHLENELGFKIDILRADEVCSKCRHCPMQ